MAKVNGNGLRELIEIGMNLTREGIVIEEEFSNVGHVAEGSRRAAKSIVRANKHLKGGERGGPIGKKFARKVVVRNVHFHEFRERGQSIGKRSIKMIVAQVELMKR